MGLDNPVGKIVISTAGRDIKKTFIVVGMLNENFVYIADGSLRKIEKPKKKKIKHLVFTEDICENIKRSIMSSEMVSNSKIENYLKSYEANKEV